MDYNIDTISTTNYGLYISTSDGLLNLPEGKEQFVVAYGYEGHQITKRKGNELDLRGFIIANDLADWLNKTQALFTKFSAAGLRAITDHRGNSFNCFAKDGYKIDRVQVAGNTYYARFAIKLIIV